MTWKKQEMMFLLNNSLVMEQFFRIFSWEIGPHLAPPQIESA